MDIKSIGVLLVSGTIFVGSSFLPEAKEVKPPPPQTINMEPVKLCPVGGANGLGAS